MRGLEATRLYQILLGPIALALHWEDTAHKLVDLRTSSTRSQNPTTMKPATDTSAYSTTTPNSHHQGKTHSTYQPPKCTRNQPGSKVRPMA